MFCTGGAILKASSHVGGMYRCLQKLTFNQRVEHSALVLSKEQKFAGQLRQSPTMEFVPKRRHSWHSVLEF